MNECSTDYISRVPHLGDIFHRLSMLRRVLVWSANTPPQLTIKIKKNRSLRPLVLTIVHRLQNGGTLTRD
jgi:hypothetical protein